jgi:hypothetical protein
MAQIRITGNPLKDAAEVIAAACRVMASRFSTEIPGAIRSYLGPTGTSAFVAAGHPGGKWGWTPIHAWMFEEPHNGRTPKHPLFGNRKKWFYQPYRPFMEQGAEAAGQQAANVFAEKTVAQWCVKHGWK